MKLRPETWHFQLYVKAYIRDRDWLVGSMAEDYDRDSVPYQNYYAFQGYLYDRYDEQGWHGAITAEESSIMVVLREELEQYEKARASVLNAQRGEELRQRLLASRMSLCPYFWSVVYALVMYKGLPQVKRTLATPATFALNSVVGLVGAFVLVLIGWGLFKTGSFLLENGSNITGGVASVVTEGVPATLSRIASVPSALNSSFQDWKKERAAEEEKERRQDAIRRQWELDHPEELRAEQEYQRALEARRSQYRLQDYKTMFREFGQVVAFVLVFLIGLAAFILALAGVLIGSIKAVEWFGRLPKVAAFNARRKRLTHDTWELVRAFARARMEKVCPYLEVEGKINI